jgi:sortase B
MILLFNQYKSIFGGDNRLVNKPNVFKALLMAIAAIVFLLSVYKVLVYTFDRYENLKTSSEMKELYYYDTVKAGSNQIVPETESIEFVQTLDLPPDQQVRVQNKFVELTKKNEDIVGWLKIENTAIDYPVTQAEDNDFYLDKDVSKNANAAGSIFMDFRNNVVDLDRHIILYGHNMKDGSMFADLLHYESRWNFQNQSFIQFDTLFTDAKWEIFSVYTTDANVDYLQTEFQSDEEYRSFLETIKAKSLHSSNVILSQDDRILTLSTCSYAFNDARFVVHAKLVKE